MKLTLTVTGLFVTGLLCFPMLVTAETPFPVESIDPVVRNDFVIGPGKVELEVAPGEAVETEITVANRMGEPKTFRIAVEDMTGSHEVGAAVILLGDDRGPYTLRDYISAPVYEFTLEHGTRARIPITVSLPADAEPGGRYGSVLVSTVSREASADAAGGAAARSAIVGRVGTLFFVTTPGIEQQSGSAAGFTAVPNRSIFSRGPITFGVMYTNDGSIHTNPYGYISITNITGDEVGFVELEPWYALPDSTRLREVIWDREGLFGRYTATAVINRGYDDVVDTLSFTFWVVQWQLVIVFVGAACLLLGMVRYMTRRFEIKRK